MRTKNITKHPDYNCYQHPYYLIGGKDGSEPQKIELPYFVELKISPNLGRWLNQNCEGWYSGATSWREWNAGKMCFELLTDAFQAKMVHGTFGR